MDGKKVALGSTPAWVTPGLVVAFLLTALNPKPAKAVVVNTSIPTSWETTATQDQQISNCVTQSSYRCELDVDGTLYTYTETPMSCHDQVEIARTGLSFDLSNIPSS